MKDQLLEKIETDRKTMHVLTKTYGFVDEKVVACSKRLDKLIVQYQKLEYNKIKNDQWKLKILIQVISKKINYSKNI